MYDYTGHVDLTRGGLEMRSATVSKLKATLSEHLARVKAGEEVVVTERGKPIAKIVPIGRDQILTRAQEEQMRRVVTHLAADWTEIQPSHRVRDAAARALTLHSLSAADALQLAAGLLWADGHPAHHDFVCLDQRLQDAARAEGFQLLP